MPAKRVAQTSSSSLVAPPGSAQSEYGGGAGNAWAQAQLRSHQVLAPYEALSTEQLIEQVGALSADEREALLAATESVGPDTDAELVRRVRGAAVAQAATALEGDLYWAGAARVDSGDNDRDGVGDYEPYREVSRSKDALFGVMGTETNHDDFIAWVRDGGPEPKQDAKMNCWEMVFFSAYKGGLISKGWIVDLYDQATATGQRDDSQVSYMRVLGDALGQSSAVPALPSGWDPSQGDPTLEVAPGPGDVLFFDGLNHVAVATGTRDSSGRHEIVSLWQLPGNFLGFNSETQTTTVEELLMSASKLGGMQMSVAVAPMPF